MGDDELRRFAHPDIDSTAILLNRASAAIANMAFIWHVRLSNGQVVEHRFAPGTNPSVLLPFGPQGSSAKFRDFWNTILPGSKRLLMPDGCVLGDNTDVRPPAEDELWHGGFWGIGAGPMDEDLDPVKLTLDGVFFVDGGFAGPNRLRSWDQTVFAAEAHLACAALARQVRAKDLPAPEFFAQVQIMTGQTAKESMPPPPFWGNESLGREAIRAYQQRMIGLEVFNHRQSLGDEAALDRIDAWNNAPVPHFHKR